MTLCADHVSDGVWIGQHYPIECVHLLNCSAHGCFWRRFHQLSPAQHARRADSSAPAQDDLFGD
jgi:hypothetical protein